MSPEFMKISPGTRFRRSSTMTAPAAHGDALRVRRDPQISRGKVRKILSGDAVARAKVDQWLFYGSATFTTLAQQFGHWTIRSPVKAPPAQEHYEANLRDMLGILDRHLAANEYFGGDYSIADMTMYSDVHLHGVNDIGLQRLSQCEALARCHRGASGRAAGLGPVSRVTIRSRGDHRIAAAPGEGASTGCSAGTSRRFSRRAGMAR